ncbi:hypothetical protein D3C74_403970 [compost metagenome]
MVPSFCTRLAMVSDFVLRNVSAWALPLPSASASAKLANSSVNSKMKNTAMLYPRPASDAVKRSGLIHNKSVMNVPTSTMNMTGFLIMTTGLSFLNASSEA